MSIIGSQWSTKDSAIDDFEFNLQQHWKDDTSEFMSQPDLGGVNQNELLEDLKRINRERKTSNKINMSKTIKISFEVNIDDLKKSYADLNLKIPDSQEILDKVSNNEVVINLRDSKFDQDDVAAAAAVEGISILAIMDIENLDPNTLSNM